MINTKKPLTMTADEIAAWEANDKNRRKISAVAFDSEFMPEGTEAKFWIVKPNKNTINVIASYGKEKVDKANDVLLNGCIIAGNTEVLNEDDDLFYGVIEEVGKLFDSKKKK
jgi:SepF-like predicted cell division protein (DUF552 family)